MANKAEEERSKITAETILVNKGLATRLPDGGIVHTTAGLAAGVQNMTHQEIIDTYTAEKHLRPDQFGQDK